MSKYGYITAKQAITQIRAALKRRSGKQWSVRNSRGTGYGWIWVCSPPSRGGPNNMTIADRLELSELFGLNFWQVGMQGFSIPSDENAYHEYIDRAEGNEILIRYEIDHYAG